MKCMRCVRWYPTITGSLNSLCPCFFFVLAFGFLPYPFPPPYPRPCPFPFIFFLSLFVSLYLFPGSPYFPDTCLPISLFPPFPCSFPFPYSFRSLLPLFFLTLPFLSPLLSFLIPQTHPFPFTPFSCPPHFHALRPLLFAAALLPGPSSERVMWMYIPSHLRRIPRRGTKTAHPPLAQYIKQAAACPWETADIGHWATADPGHWATADPGHWATADPSHWTTANCWTWIFN